MIRDVVGGKVDEPWCGCYGAEASRTSRDCVARGGGRVDEHDVGGEGEAGWTSHDMVEREQNR